MKMKKKYIIISIIIIIIICICVLFKQYNFVSKSDKQVIIGIIDESISKSYDNVITNSKNRAKIKTHGDKMIIFANACNSKNEIYYYDASNNGQISTDNIIKGLEWMVEKSVPKVNLSLSSKIYSDELDKWIVAHAKIIEIFASYNNNVNSYDFPAMYTNVIASGKKTLIAFKKNDYSYKSSKIIAIKRFKFEFYEGNSYLSILTMIRDSL